MSQSSYSRRRRSGFTASSDSEEDDRTLGQLMHRLEADKGVRSPSPARKFEMATPSTGGGKLAQEIHDEFLVCKICLECYRNPKSLNCLHTFCEQCIESHVMSESTYKKYSDYREFTCPLCRKRTQLPIGGVKKLPDNFLVSSLSEIVTRQKPSKFPFCDFCKLMNRKHKEAQSKCLDCAKLLCKQCVDLHRETKVTANHSIFDVEIEKDIECHDHEGEVVRFYCEPCETCICVLCTFNEHKDHEITQFSEAVVKYKDNIQKMLQNCKDKINKFDNQIVSLNKCEEVIKEAETKIHDTAIQFIADIRAREKQLLEEIKNIYGHDTMEYIDNKKDLATTVDGLRSTCSLTEIILKGKDMELLLLKKDVQEKLGALDAVEINDLPSTINKQINFVCGTLDMGYVEDADKPLISKQLKRPSFDHGDSGYQGPTLMHATTQTDLQGKVVKAKDSSSKQESDSDSETETDEDDEEDEEEEEEEEEETEDESEDEKPETDEKGVQTDIVDKPKNVPAQPVMKDQAIETDQIPTEEKAVNTRSRSMQSLSHMRKSPPKDETGGDNSLAARRRRRRERAHTTNLSGSLDLPESSSPDQYHNDPEAYGDRRKHRSRFLYNHSMDDDTFYDAETQGHARNSTLY